MGDKCIIEGMPIRRPSILGSSNPNYKGGGTIPTTGGYLVRYVHGVRVYEHRRVWEEAHGRIPYGAVIHHIDGNPSNNDLANLQMIQTQGEHRTLHRCPPCVLCGKKGHIAGLCDRHYRMTKRWREAILSGKVIRKTRRIVGR